jgi:Amt family ammonium transporter
MGIAVQKARLYQDVKNQAIELERANKVKDEFLSVMSHEIRTPLNTFIGYTEMVRDKMVGEINRKQEEVLGKALDHAGNLFSMITRVLLTTQIDVGMVQVESHELNLSEFLDQLKSTYGLPSVKDVALRWNYPPDLPLIKTDSNQLKLILQNLLNNALKFTHEGHVVVSARHIPGSGIVEFQVADTGIGIRKESLSDIFGKFRQADRSETRHYGGAGLGLYIAKRMTESLGGSLEVKSEFGKGSTFTFTIPCGT